MRRRYAPWLMSDDPIRDLLAGLPRADKPTNERDVAITLAAVIDANGDPQAVERWVKEQGGRTEYDEFFEQPSLRAGRSFKREGETGETYFLVPRTALEK
jgi:hypothetical protein